MSPQPILIKRYARARLYHPAGRRYVSIEELARWKGAGVAFTVRDTETGVDVTEVLLA